MQVTFRSFWWNFYKPYKISMILVVSFAIFVGLHGVINAYLTKEVIDRIVQSGEHTFSIQRFIFPALMIILSFEIHNLCWRAINLINLKTAPQIKNQVVKHLFDHVHRHSVRFIQDHLSGSITNNIMVLAENMERIGSNLSVRLIRSATQLFAALLGMSLIHPFFSLALFVWALTFISISMLFSKRVSSLSNRYAEGLSTVTGKVVDSITNFSTVKLFSRQQFETSYLKVSLDDLKERFCKKEWFLIRFYFTQGFSITCLIGCIIYLLLRLSRENLLTAGDCAFILGVSYFVTENVWSGTEQIDQMYDAIGKCKQSLKALFKPIEIRNHKEAKPLRLKKGKIEFENVGFYYSPQKPLFVNKCLTIYPKERVGVVGYSGSGKSTFINLILRLFDVVEGRILIDGQDIRNVTQETLRKAIGVIPQSPVLFHRSLMENIRYGSISAKDHDVVQAAKYAEVHDFISTMPNGYQSLVGENGVKLSSGQRQRVAIARALLKNAPILVVDEATSHLDPITECKIKVALNKLMEGKTTIVIAHRLSTLLQMDRILVFDKGKIVEVGTHQELLALNGCYKVLWDSQIGGFIPHSNYAMLD